jgi:hypothetical protein
MPHQNASGPATLGGGKARQANVLERHQRLTHSPSPAPIQRILAARRDPHLRHLAHCIHALGERPLFELLAELKAGADLIPALERYAALDPSIVRALGGDRLPPPASLIGGQP